MNKKLVAVLSTTLLVFSSVAPVFADSTITISGNGSDTTNVSSVTVTQTTAVQQTNSANIDNNVNATSNSGNNTVNHNTGGNSSVDTGNAKTQVSIANSANTNVANVDGCNCGTGDLAVTVSGNGDGSKNTATTAVTNQVQLGQVNDANISNNVNNAVSNSGNNSAGFNTGGNTSISTGNATTNVSLMTDANQNIASVGGSNVLGNGSTASVMITGNGTDTTNVVSLGLTDWVVLGQTNSANVDNDVNASSITGNNTADHNTGGSSTLFGGVNIDTGNALTNVLADTAVNFNSANVGCDCLMGVTAKISGNGASDTTGTVDVITAALTNGQTIGQANGGNGIDNDLLGDSQTGANNANLNTGVSTDPSIMTGDSTSNTAVTNQGNANIFGSDSFNPFPWNWSNTNVTLTFSLSQLLLALGIH